jgi:hypothetical protein
MRTILAVIVAAVLVADVLVADVLVVAAVILHFSTTGFLLHVIIS